MFINSEAIVARLNRGREYSATQWLADIVFLKSLLWGRVQQVYKF